MSMCLYLLLCGGLYHSMFNFISQPLDSCMIAFIPALFKVFESNKTPALQYYLRIKHNHECAVVS